MSISTNPDIPESELGSDIRDLKLLLTNLKHPERIADPGNEETGTEDKAILSKLEDYEDADIARNVHPGNKEAVDAVAKDKAILSKLEDYEDHRLLDADIARNVHPGNKDAVTKKELAAEKQKDGLGNFWEDLSSAMDEESTRAASRMESRRWSLEEEVNKLVDEALELSFPRLGETSNTFICKEEYGDYQCENVLSIWPKLLEEGTKLKGPKTVGGRIKSKLEKRPDMIEGTPDIRSIGFVTFKLSGRWMAESLYMMLRDGIHTWAPKLPVRRVLIQIPDYEGPIWDSVLGSEADFLRPNYIRDVFVRMLQYSQVFVRFYEIQSDELSDVPNLWNRRFLIENRGDSVISAEVEGEWKSLNFGKRDIQDISDSLDILRYALEVLGVDWVVCLNPTRQQEYIEMCFTAVDHAGWIPAKHHGLSFAGYRVHAEAGKLVYLLKSALARCTFLVVQGKAAEYTPERVFECALGYEYLKKPRMAECTFSVDEMLNEEGNTFLYLLNTKSLVLSVLANSHKDINSENVSELLLEKQVLEKDGRVLGFHLLLFTQVLEESCLSVLPHILCQYLYELCQKFTCYNSSCVPMPKVGSVAETRLLVLCKATLAVMEECFDLLGITQFSTTSIIFEPLELLYELESQMGPKDVFNSGYDSVICSLPRDPPKSSRIEIIALSPEITKDKFESGKMFGRIQVEDKHGLLCDGWMPTPQPDFGLVPLFNSDWYNPVGITNHGLLSLGNPVARHSLPLTTSILWIRTELVITTEREDAFHHIQTMQRVDVPYFRDMGDDSCGSIMVCGKDVSVLMYCVMLKDAVDASLEIKFKAKDGRLKVKGYIYAYYGPKFPYVDDTVVKSFYVASLVEPGLHITAGSVALKRSKMAVPKEGSLVIEAKLADHKSGKVLIKGCYEFPSKVESCSIYSIPGTIPGCSLDLRVDWTYQA